MRRRHREPRREHGIAAAQAGLRKRPASATVNLCTTMDRQLPHPRIKLGHDDAIEAPDPPASPFRQNRARQWRWRHERPDRDLPPRTYDRGLGCFPLRCSMPAHRPGSHVDARNRGISFQSPSSVQARPRPGRALPQRWRRPPRLANTPPRASGYCGGELWPGSSASRVCQGRQIAASSSPVTIRNDADDRSATAVSIATMRACACGLRRNATWPRFATSRSSV